MPADVLTLTPRQLAERLNLHTSTLAAMRVRGDGPPFVTIGKRAVGYRMSDVDTWLASRVRRSTSQPLAA